MNKNPSHIMNEDRIEPLQLKFDGFFDWLIKFNDPVSLWKLQPTYIAAQLSFLLGGFITLHHAKKNGGRFPYLWIATLLHGMVVEAVSYNFEDIDNFWHSQTPIMLLGRRLPIHIVVLYPVFIYHAYVAVSRMNISKWAEPFAVGLLVVLIDIPYDIVSVKFVHWTWHDTDPNIADRHYWVPWNSYYFHACFAASFTFWFNLWHRWIVQQKDNKRGKSVSRGIICSILTGLLAMPGGVLLFIPLYHPLHDDAHIHSEVTFMMLFSVFLLIVWSADRQPKRKPNHEGDEMKWKIPLVGHLVIHYFVFFAMVVFGNPEKEVSVGLHETVGPCNESVSLKTTFGSVLKKRKYLCISDYDEGYFDFTCLSKTEALTNGISWYKVCGTPFENRTEYIAIIGTICFIALVVFSNIYCNKNANKISKKKD